MTTLRHFDNEGTARFVTFSCYRRLPFLNDNLAKHIVIEELQRVRDKHNFRLFAYVIMPEHVHLVILPAEGMRLGLVIGELKSVSARRFFQQRPCGPPGEKRILWLRRCYDHNCRTPESTIEKIKYCHNNPVARGLVSDPRDWKWSSYNCYSGQEGVPLVVDKIEA